MSLVLVGGGHTHALLLKTWIENPNSRPQGDIVLISQYAKTAYSGLLSAVLQKRLPESRIMIPIQQLCSRANVEFIQDVAIGLNAQAKEVYLGFRIAAKYDVLSINCGGYVPRISPRSWRSWIEKLDQSKDSIVIAGAGIAGIETALALRVRFPTREIKVVELEPDILLEARPRLRRKVNETLKAKKIEVQTGLKLDNNLPGSLIINCSGTRAPRWLLVSGLQTVGKLIAIQPTLQTSDQSVFATGDCAQIVRSHVPRAGVYAIREAPILAANLKRMVAGQISLYRYRPQRKHMILMPVDQQRAMVFRGGFGLGPHSVWMRMKNRIDQNFIEGLERIAE